MFDNDTSLSVKAKVSDTLNHQVNEQWSSEKYYLEAKAIVNDMSVVNDVAERGVKLCSEFLTSSRYFKKLYKFIEMK